MDKNTKEPSVEQVAQVARLAARLMLESGGETYRAEDIANHIALAFGLKTDIIAFPTGLTMTLTGENNEVSSVIARVDRISTDLMKLEQVNSVSRALCGGKLTLENKGGTLYVTVTGEAGRITCLELEGPAEVLACYSI